MPKEFNVPARGGKNGIRYQYFPVDTNFDEDRWVQAVEARPGNRAVVHHIIVYVLKPGQGMRQNRIDGIGDGFLVAFAPGELPAVFAPGTAKKVPKGAKLLFQMHYTPNGVEQKDRSSVGLIFAKQPPQHEVRTRAITQRRLSIPAGEGNYEAQSATTFTEDARLLSLMPHMHLRGKDFEYRVVFPDGKSDILLRVPRYDFGWQSNYRLSKPLDLPAGTRIECTAHFDNSTDNPNNPDATKLVRWGEQTWEEMMIGFVDYVVLEEGELTIETQRRKEKKKRTAAVADRPRGCPLSSCLLSASVSLWLETHNSAVRWFSICSRSWAKCGSAWPQVPQPPLPQVPQPPPVSWPQLGRPQP